jgi:hypothetical protein
MTLEVIIVIGVSACVVGTSARTEASRRPNLGPPARHSHERERLSVVPARGVAFPVEATDVLEVSAVGSSTPISSGRRSSYPR